MKSEVLTSAAGPRLSPPHRLTELPGTPASSLVPVHIFARARLVSLQFSPSPLAQLSPWLPPARHSGLSSNATFLERPGHPTHIPSTLLVTLHRATQVIFFLALATI